MNPPNNINIGNDHEVNVEQETKKCETKREIQTEINRITKKTKNCIGRLQTLRYAIDLSLNFSFRFAFFRFLFDVNLMITVHGNINIVRRIHEKFPQ